MLGTVAVGTASDHNWYMQQHFMVGTADTEAVGTTAMNHRSWYSRADTESVGATVTAISWLQVQQMKKQ